MGKVRTMLACSACGHATGQWVGRCPACQEWGTIQEAHPAGRGRAAASLTLLATEDGVDERLTTGLSGVDRVLGGGLVPGSVVLVAGEPGIGKSTLLLHLAANLAGTGRACLYASGEESAEQVAARSRRLGLPAGAVSFTVGRELPDVLDAARASGHAVLFVDSIQAIRDPELTSLPGGPSQVRACADALIGLAKRERVTVVLAGQVTKDGEIAGPRTLEHAVDVVCSFDGDSRTGLRVLAGGKNRFGAEGEVAWFEMEANGLREVDPARALSTGVSEPGAAVALLAAGRRGLVIEVQALTIDTQGPPRRQVSGLDPRRFGLVAAVVDRATKHKLVGAELYGAAAGGLRIDDPGADLAMAAALASAATNVAPPERSAFVGELSLTGSVRSVPNLAARLGAAAASGVQTVFAPPGATSSSPVRVREVGHVREALAWVRGKAE